MKTTDKVFSDMAQAEAEFEKQSKALHEKLDGDPKWQSKRFDTLDEAIDFFKDSHPHIADSLRRQKAEIASIGKTVAQ